MNEHWTDEDVEAAAEALRQDAETRSRSTEESMRVAGVTWGCFSVNHGGVQLSLHTHDSLVVTVIRPTLDQAMRASLDHLPTRESKS